MVCILWSFALWIYEHDVTREHISCTLELREILLLVQTSFSIVSLLMLALREDLWLEILISPGI